MREAYRIQKHELMDLLAQQDKKLSVFFIYTGRELLDYNIIFEKLGLTLERLKKTVG